VRISGGTDVAPVTGVSSAESVAREVRATFPEAVITVERNKFRANGANSRVLERLGRVCGKWMAARRYLMLSTTSLNLFVRWVSNVVSSERSWMSFCAPSKTC
jgi:hypothetical protein